jgi:hypothetical protein
MVLSVAWSDRSEARPAAELQGFGGWDLAPGAQPGRLRERVPTS